MSASLPRFGDFELDVEQADAKAFQVIMLVSLLLLPTIGMVHFQTTFFEGTACGLPNNCKPGICSDIFRISSSGLIAAVRPRPPDRRAYTWRYLQEEPNRG